MIQCLNIPEGVEVLAGYADTWDVYVAQYKKSGPDALPLSSVCLANFRDGFEDYEYLHLLQELGGDTEVIKKVVDTPTKYTSDPHVLSKTWEEIATMIELKKKNQ